MTYDLVISGGTIVTPDHEFIGDLGVVDEAIVALGDAGRLAEHAHRTIDASGCMVIPGGIDPHTHYNVGFAGVTAEHQEFTIAAAFGGTTTVIDFAFQFPGMTLHDAVREKRQEADGRMGVDYGLHAILIGDVSFDVIEEIGDIIRNGIPTIKTFTAYPEVMTDDGHRYGVMTEVAAQGGMSVVHAEDEALSSWLTKHYLRQGKRHGGYIAETRGPLVEEAAVRRTLLLAERTHSPLYILHIAAGSAVTALVEARGKGFPFYGETLIAYLSFTAEKLWDDENRGLLWNNIPPIKSAQDQEVLWRAIADNGLQVVATDQFAVSAADRYEKEGTTVDELQAGQAAVELRVPVLFHLGVQTGRLSLRRFVELTSTNPARLMGLYPRKGIIGIGSDADVTIIDPRERWIVDHEDLHMGVDWNCWDGWELDGKVTHTILRGQVLVENGNLVGSPSSGQFIARNLLPELTRFP